MKTRCNVCRTKIDYGNSLCDSCKSKKIKENKSSLKDQKAEDLLKTKKWQTKRKDILLRDKGVCQLCLRRDKYIERRRLEVHHIVKRTIDKNLAFEDSNLITVCKKCHEQLEKMKPSEQKNLLGIKDIKTEIDFFL